MEHWNSDDLVFSPNPSSKKKRAGAGEKSIQEMLITAVDDRIASKREVKQLEFGRGAPGTQSAQSLWVRRFESFREHTLQQDPTQPYSGDDLIRFFSTIIGKSEEIDARANDVELEGTWLERDEEG